MIRIINLNQSNCHYVGSAHISTNTSCVNLRKLFKTVKNDFYNELSYISQKNVLSKCDNNIILGDRYLLDYILSFVQKTRRFKFENIRKITEEYTLLPFFNNFKISSTEKYYMEDENIFLGKKYNILESNLETKGFIMFDNKSYVKLSFDLFCVNKNDITPFLKMNGNIINMLNPKSGIFHSHNFKDYAVIGVSNFEKNVQASFMKLVLMFYKFGINKGNMNLCMFDAIDWLRQHISNIRDNTIYEFNKQTLWEDLNKIERLSSNIFTEHIVSNFKNFAISFN